MLKVHSKHLLWDLIPLLITKTPVRGVHERSVYHDKSLSGFFENAFNEEVHMQLLSLNTLSPFNILTWIGSLKRMIFILHISLGGFDLSGGMVFFFLAVNLGIDFIWIWCSKFHNPRQFV